jgi:hypothetical protein
MGLGFSLSPNETKQYSSPLFSSAGSLCPSQVAALGWGHEHIFFLFFQVLYALRHKLKPRAGATNIHPWALLAIDVAYDTAQNAYVLDVNTGPAPSGTQHAPWYLRDRSATIREAVDILQV